MTPHVQEQLLDFAYGELPGGDTRAVEAHLKECPSCQGAMASIQGVRQVMAKLPPESAPEAGLDSLLGYAQQAARRIHAGPAPKATWWRRAVLPLAAAAALAVVVLVALPVAKTVPASAPVLEASDNAVGLGRVESLEAPRAQSVAPPRLADQPAVAAQERGKIFQKGAGPEGSGPAELKKKAPVEKVSRPLAELESNAPSAAYGSGADKDDAKEVRREERDEEAREAFRAPAPARLVQRSESADSKPQAAHTPAATPPMKKEAVPKSAFAAEPSPAAPSGALAGLQGSAVSGEAAQLDGAPAPPAVVANDMLRAGPGDARRAHAGGGFKGLGSSGAGASASTSASPPPAAAAPSPVMENRKGDRGRADSAAARLEDFSEAARRAHAKGDFAGEAHWLEQGLAAGAQGSDREGFLARLCEAQRALGAREVVACRQYKQEFPAAAKAAKAGKTGVLDDAPAQTH